MKCFSFWICYTFCVVLYKKNCCQSWNFKIASKFKMDAKTFFSFKTFKFDFFTNYFLDYGQNMAKIFNMADFLHQNSWFFRSGIWIKCSIFFGYVILLALFYCKKNCCQSWKIKMASLFKMASKMFIFVTQYFQK
jgi:hypothetical protein